MLKNKQTKSSQYIVYIGWGIKAYADNINDINELIRLWGEEKISFEKLFKGGK